NSFFFFFQAEDGIRYFHVTGVQTCALPIYLIQNLYNVIANTSKLSEAYLDGIEKFAENKEKERKAALSLERAGMFAEYGTDLTRSEEHTSELQSRENFVCRLLLEKKKSR